MLRVYILAMKFYGLYLSNMFNPNLLTKCETFWCTNDHFLWSYKHVGKLIYLFLSVSFEKIWQKLQKSYQKYRRKRTRNRSFGYAWLGNKSRHVSLGLDEERLFERTNRRARRCRICHTDVRLEAGQSVSHE